MQVLHFALETAIFTYVDMSMTGKVKVDVQLGGVSQWIQATVTPEATNSGKANA